MPLFKSVEVNSQTIVKIWHILEPLEEFLSQIYLAKGSQSRLNGMKSEEHQRQFLSVRLLLNSFGYNDDDLSYDSNGKPYLNDRNFISITHSTSYSAVAVSTRPVGIDLEGHSDKLAKVESKFVGYESCYLNQNIDDYVRKLTRIWCTKEALYKLYSKPGMSFKNQFMVIPFGRHHTTTSWILDGITRQCYHTFLFEIEDHTCAVVTPK